MQLEVVLLLEHGTLLEKRVFLGLLVLLLGPQARSLLVVLLRKGRVEAGMVYLEQFLLGEQLLGLERVVCFLALFLLRLLFVQGLGVFVVFFQLGRLVLVLAVVQVAVVGRGRLQAVVGRRLRVARQVALSCLLLRRGRSPPRALSVAVVR